MPLSPPWPQSPAGLARTDTTDVGLGEANCPKGYDVRKKMVAAMRSGRYYCSTGVTITDVRVEGRVITVETSDADTLHGSIDHGEVKHISPPPVTSDMRVGVGLHLPDLDLAWG